MCARVCADLSEQHVLLQVIEKGGLGYYCVEVAAYDQNGVDNPFFDCRLLNR